MGGAMTGQTERGFLPHILFEMADKFGLPTALEFAVQYGGRHIYLPKAAHAGHEVAQKFSIELLGWMIEKWRDGDLLIPIGPQSTHAQLNRKIRAMAVSGVAASDVTRAVGCHERTVYRHRQRARNAVTPPLLAILGEKK